MAATIGALWVLPPPQGTNQMTTNNLQPNLTYQILVAQNGLNFSHRFVRDPIPLGRQILESAGLDPRSDYSLFAILDNGDFEDVRLDESIDLRVRGAERFVAFATDRDYKLTINGGSVAWGKPAIKGAQLYALAKADGDMDVYQEVRGGIDRLIDPSELIDLMAPGIERFITAPRGQLTFEIIVNGRLRTVTGRQMNFEQVIQLAFPGSQPEQNVAYSITYRKTASDPHEGDLGAGGMVQVKNGTIFNVSKTVQS
jgi:hypothetical protein